MPLTPHTARPLPIRSASRPIQKKRAHSRRKTQPGAPELRRRGLLVRLASFLGRSSAHMKQMGAPIDGSYCHVGAGYAAAYLALQDVDVQLFQPRPHHTLATFVYQGRRYFVDQTMAQFFRKGTSAHKRLMKEGGFVGEAAAFRKFYARYIDDVKAWGDYQDGGHAPRRPAQSNDEILYYEMWERGTRWAAMNTRKARTERVMHTWYGGFVSNADHELEGGLLWSAVSFELSFYTNLFAVGGDFTLFSPR